MRAADAVLASFDAWHEWETAQAHAERALRTVQEQAQAAEAVHRQLLADHELAVNAAIATCEPIPTDPPPPAPNFADPMARATRRMMGMRAARRAVLRDIAPEVEARIRENVAARMTRVTEAVSVMEREREALAGLCDLLAQIRAAVTPDDAARPNAATQSRRSVALTDLLDAGEGRLDLLAPIPSVDGATVHYGFSKVIRDTGPAEGEAVAQRAHVAIPRR